MSNRELLVPIEWEDFLEKEISSCIFYDVTFYKPFGTIKIGEKFDQVYVNYVEGIVETCDPDGEVLNRITFIGTPITEQVRCSVCDRWLGDKKCGNKYCTNWVCHQCPPCHP